MYLTVVWYHPRPVEPDTVGVPWEYLPRIEQPVVCGHGMRHSVLVNPRNPRSPSNIELRGVEGVVEDAYRRLVLGGSCLLTRICILRLVWAIRVRTVLIRAVLRQGDGREHQYDHSR